MSDLEVLLELQEHDSAIDRIRYRVGALPERAAKAERESEMAALDAHTSSLNAARMEAQGAQKKDEAEAAGISDRIAGLEKSMYSGSVSATRELQAMSHEVAQLSERRSAVEDRILESMERIEAIDTDIGVAASRRGELESEVASLEETIAGHEEEAGAEIAVHAGRRERAVEGLPADVVQRYEQLRARFGGIAVAKLVSGACSGCHLSLPAVELDAIRHAAPGTVPVCEQCGRILVP